MSNDEESHRKDEDENILELHTQSTRKDMSRTPIKNESLMKQTRSNDSSCQKKSKNPNFYKSMQVSPVGLHSRLGKFREETSKKLQKLSTAQEEVLMSECTFKPKINSRSKRRAFEVFLKNQQKFEEKRRQKHTPESESQIVHSSSKKSSPLIFEKLYKHTKIKSVDLDAFSFQPEINPQSKNIERNEPIESHLYKDAVRRMTQSKSTSKLETHTLTNKSSEVILTSKFTHEFNTLFDSLAKNGQISYALFSVLLQNMHFIHAHEIETEKVLTREAWDSLTSELSLSKKPLLTFLLYVMNLKKHPEVHKKFNLFYLNRKSIKKPPKKTEQNCPFRPSIAKKSKELAEKYKEKVRGGRSPLQFLEKQRAPEHMKKKIELQKSELEECTFVPKINNYTRDTHCYRRTDSPAYQWIKMREEKSSHISISLFNCSKIKRLQSTEFYGLEEYSFTPTLRKSLMKDKRPLGEARGVISAIDRIRTARNDKEITEIKERAEERTSQRKFEYVFPTPKQDEEIPKQILQYLCSSISLPPRVVYPVKILVLLPSKEEEFLVVESEQTQEKDIQLFAKEHKLDKIATKKLKNLIKEKL